MTDKLIQTDGTSSGLSAGAAISDTDAIEVQQTTTAPASTVYTTFAAIKTWIKSWIAKADVGLGNVANSLQAIASNNGSDFSDKAATLVNLGGSPILFKSYVLNRYYKPFGTVVGASAAVPVANRIQFFPVMVPQKVTISEFMIRVTTGSSGNWQGAIYLADATTLLPTGSAVATSSANGSTTSSSQNAVTTLSANYQLLPGVLYWFAINVDNTTATFPGLSTSQGNFSLIDVASLIGDATPANVIGGGSTSPAGVYYATTQTVGTWPNLTSASFTLTNSAVPIVGFKVASVP